MKLYVGNLPWSITDVNLKELFSEAIEVTLSPEMLRLLVRSYFYDRRRKEINASIQDYLSAKNGVSLQRA
jgi:RNA recognition motif-containing protein